MESLAAYRMPEATTGTHAPARLFGIRGEATSRLAFPAGVCDAA
jgi:hypothetical protein